VFNPSRGGGGVGLKSVKGKEISVKFRQGGGKRGGWLAGGKKSFPCLDMGPSILGQTSAVPLQKEKGFECRPSASRGRPWLGKPWTANFGTPMLLKKKEMEIRFIFGEKGPVLWTDGTPPQKCNKKRSEQQPFGEGKEEGPPEFGSKSMAREKKEGGIHDFPPFPPKGPPPGMVIKGP